MRLARFRDERAADWAALDALLARAGGKPERLGADGVRELGARYRQAVADLALARRLFPAEATTTQLEARVARARQAVYGEAGATRSPLRFLLGGYWRAVRGLGGALAISVVLLFGSAGLTTLWGATSPDAVRALVPSEYIDAADPPDANQHLSSQEASEFSSEVFTNNIGVTLTVFAAGILFGVGGGALLIFNGISLGAVLGLAVDAGTFDELLRHIASHGFLELSCICVGGAAGMRFGWVLVDPGRLPRREALAAAARPTLAVAMGTAPFLVIAGLMEGFVTPAGIRLVPALLVGGGLGALYWTGVALLGRRGVTAAPAP